MFPRLMTAAGRAPRASLFTLVPALVIFASPWLTAALAFDRAAIDGGEWWRLVTGHWTHWTLDHLWWDGAVYLVLAVVCERLGRTLLLRTVALSVTACSVAVWWLAPDLGSYRGLSGIDSALFAAAGTVVVRNAASTGNWKGALPPMTLFAGFIAKAAFEAITGTTIFVDSVSAGTVAVPIAHVAGAVAGGVAGLAYARVRPMDQPPPGPGVTGCTTAPGGSQGVDLVTATDDPRAPGS